MSRRGRDLYLNTLPSLSKEYVQTGKVRLLHRDFPLQQHQFSRIATRYANAAGEMGKYDLVGRIRSLLTQSEWAQNGNMDAVLSKGVVAGGSEEGQRDGEEFRYEDR